MNGSAPEFVYPTEIRIEMTPKIVADAFAAMDSGQQAETLIEVARIGSEWTGPVDQWYLIGRALHTAGIGARLARELIEAIAEGIDVAEEEAVDIDPDSPRILIAPSGVVPVAETGFLDVPLSDGGYLRIPESFSEGDRLRLLSTIEAELAEIREIARQHSEASFRAFLDSPEPF